MRSNIKHLRREQLIEATIDTIAKHGFRKTTLSQVAKRAKPSQGTVNFYFKTRGGLPLETLKFLAEAAPEGTLARRNKNRVARCNELQMLGKWRPGPESNRRTRICSPLHNHSATGPPVRADKPAGSAGEI